MDYNKKTVAELKALCKERGIKGFTTKSKAELIVLLAAERNVLVPLTSPSATASKVALSLFSGAGGDTKGLEEAGWKVGYFSEFKDIAIQTHHSAFPDSVLLKGDEGSTDIKKIADEQFVSLRGKVDLIFAGHPCFVAGTPILTEGGYKEIQKVELEDRLLTHTGNFQRIVNLQRKNYTGQLYDFKIKYRPEVVTCTAEHPFYVRERRQVGRGSSLGEPRWKAASEITKDDYFGMVISNSEKESTRDCQVELYQNLELGLTSSFPEWYQNMSSGMTSHLLYFISKNDDGIIVVPSLELALQIQRLYLKLACVADIEKTNEGYRLPWSVGGNNDAFIENGYAWYKAEEIMTREAVDEPVYNFEVETDNSYIVQNVIAHNCQGFSHAGKKRTDDPRNELVHEFARAARLVQPTWIVGENVKGLLSRKGVYPVGTKPRPVIEIIRDIFGAIGYKITWRLIDVTEVGVPQLRKRLIYIGHKGDSYPHVPWPIPSATAPNISSLLSSTLEGAMELPDLYRPLEQDPRFWIATDEEAPTGTPHPNLKRLVEGVRNMGGKEKQDGGHDAKAKIPLKEDKGLISFGTRASGYHGQVLDPDAPSKTIICAYNQCPRLFVGLRSTGSGKFWIRCLTPVECGQIQGFPADFPWQGSAKDKIVQIGNAVPPPLARLIGSVLEKTTFSTSPQVVVNGDESSDDSDDESEV
jgi:DNA (cytosine-5)-methyltransferase 1